ASGAPRLQPSSPTRRASDLTDLFVSEPGFDEYDSEQLALTSMLNWRLNNAWTLRQNLRYQESEVSYQQIYGWPATLAADNRTLEDRKSTRLNSSHVKSSYAV